MLSLRLRVFALKTWFDRQKVSLVGYEFRLRKRLRKRERHNAQKSQSFSVRRCDLEIQKYPVRSGQRGESAHIRVQPKSIHLNDQKIKLPARGTGSHFRGRFTIL